jgi:hypothetical protein
MDDPRIDREGTQRLKFVPTAANRAVFVRTVRIVAIGLMILGAYAVLTNHPKGFVALALGFVEIALAEFIAWRTRVILRKYSAENKSNPTT